MVTVDVAPFLGVADIADAAQGEIQMSPPNSFNSFNSSQSRSFGSFQPQRHRRFGQAEGVRGHGRFVEHHEPDEHRTTGAGLGGDADDAGEQDGVGGARRAGVLACFFPCCPWHPAGGSPHDQECIRGIRETQVVEIVVAMEALRSVLGNVIVVMVQDAVSWAQWYMEEQQERNPWRLSLDEIAAVAIYTMETLPCSLYTVLNRTLRDSRRAVSLEPFFRYLRLFLGALYKLPLHKKELHRGMRESAAQLGIHSGSHSTWWGFSSTTASLHVLQSPQFLGTNGNRTLFRIKAWCVDISPYSMFGDAEDERLIMAGTRFVIGGILSPAEGLTIVDLEEDPNAGILFDFHPPPDRKIVDEVEEMRRKNARFWAMVTLEHIAILLFGILCGAGYLYSLRPRRPWEEHAELQQNVSNAAAVAFHGLVYVIGGLDSAGNKLSTVQLYNPTSAMRGVGGWKAHKFPNATMLGRVTAWDNSLYYTGGMELARSTNQVFKYAIGANPFPRASDWKRVADMQEPRSSHAVVIWKKNKELLVLGGVGVLGSVSCSKTVEAFDGTWWSYKANMMKGHCDVQAVVLTHAHKERVYVIGKDSVESFGDDVWKKEPRMMFRERGHTMRATVFSNKIYVFGGGNFESAIDSTFDAITIGTVSGGKLRWDLEWNSNTFWPNSRYDMTGCAFGHEYWMMGGTETEGDWSTASNQVWAFNFNRLRPATTAPR